MRNKEATAMERMREWEEKKRGSNGGNERKKEIWMREKELIK